MKRCDTCQKISKSGKACRVLKETIGKTEECWAWTDDPEWEEKVKKQVKDYALYGGGEGDL